VSDQSLYAAFWHAFAAYLPIGTAIGIVFAPLRLAGTDFSKWFADPGEVSERTDHTWIGMMKWTALYTGRVLLGAAVVLLAVRAIGSCVVSWMHGPSTPLDITPHASGVAHAILTWPGLGLVAGVGLAQGLAEIAWRRGLRKTKPRAIGHLTRQRIGDVNRSPPREPVPGRRRLIICCDGTWNSPLQQRETNVVALLRAIEPTGEPGHIPQIVHYHLGVGTGNFLDRWVGGGAGVGLSNSVKACYGFLVDNYRSGDEILLFGFSRGAYVVRSVAGMIGCVGLLRKNQMYRFIEAWDYYTLSPTERDRFNDDFERIFTNREKVVEIQCLGVWDTVGALGIPGTQVCSQAYAFHETKLGDHVRHAFQALAIDERRGNFQPAVWVRDAQDQHRSLEQMWFPGVHSNVGGGYEEHGLADAALLWMLSRLAEHRLLDFDNTVIRDSIARYRAEHYARGKLQDSRTLFWKTIASPIPRPVCITDHSEKVHDSARERRDVGRGDPYAGAERREWLESLTIEPRSAYETDPVFQVEPPGEKVRRYIDPKSGLCARLMRLFFGEC
jgi:uncharacterized protein (DUF2235 family)